MAAQQALPSLGFSRQEHWSGLPFPLSTCKITRRGGGTGLQKWLVGLNSYIRPPGVLRPLHQSGKGTSGSLYQDYCPQEYDHIAAIQGSWAIATSTIDCFLTSKNLAETWEHWTWRLPLLQLSLDHHYSFCLLKCTCKHTHKLIFCVCKVPLCVLSLYYRHFTEE